MFLAWVDSLPVNDQIKDKFRGLINKMPSTVYRKVIQHAHDYVRRFEDEVHRELMGLPAFQSSLEKAQIDQETPEPVQEQGLTPRIMSSWDDEEITLNPTPKEKNGNEGKDQDQDQEGPEEGTWQEISKNEVFHTNPFGLYLPGASPDADQGRPTPDARPTAGDAAPADRLHAEVSDAGIGVLRPDSELPAGPQRTEADRPATEGDNDGGLRLLDSGPSGVQGVHLSEERSREGGAGDPERTGSDRLGLPGEGLRPADEREPTSDGG